MARGYLPTLSYLDRPYTVTAIRRALRDTAGVRGSAERRWRDQVLRSLARDVYEPTDTSASAAHESVDAGFGVSVLGTAQTSGRRELMLADDDSRVVPGVEGHFFLRAGPFLAVSRVIGDRRLKYDPEFAGKTDRPLTGRTEDGYLSAQARYGQLTVGRLARNWGPPPHQGLQIGHNAYTYDHLHGRLGSARTNLSAIVARLDDRPRAGELPDHRYLAAHRLAFQAGPLELAVSEALVYGGQGRGFEPGMANPLSAVVLGQFNEFRTGNDANVTYSLESAWRTRGAGIWTLHFMLDDLQVDDCDSLCDEPPSYAVSVGAEGLPLAGAHRLFASYRQVANLTYRTNNPALGFIVYGVGLGDGLSDFDEARVGADLALTHVATTRLYAAYRRQGEGDYRDPFPLPAEYSSTPRFLSGNIHRVARLGFSASGYMRRTQVWADVGLNRSRNDVSASDDPKIRFEGRLRLQYRPGWFRTR